MQVLDSDPEVLAWRFDKGLRTILGISIEEDTFITETTRSGMSSPTDEEFNSLLDEAKELSLQIEPSVFVAVEFLVNKQRIDFIPIAEYENGELVAFCRPPWRKGERIE